MIKSRINKILEEINIKRQELFVEYEKLKKNYGFIIEWRKIIFNSETRQKNKTYKKPIIESLFSVRAREVISIPFIYSMIVPSVLLHLFLFIYQQTALRLYQIPLVSLKDYVTFDRKELDYLNSIQKINCLYCSYVNGLFSYAVEIAGRTERYRCPIKNAKKMNGWHDRQEWFADYGDAVQFRKCFANLEDFASTKKTIEK